MNGAVFGSEGALQFLIQRFLQPEQENDVAHREFLHLSRLGSFSVEVQLKTT
jgi:hypothetical protein